MKLNTRGKFWLNYLIIFFILVWLLFGCAVHGDYYALDAIHQDLYDRFEPAPLANWPDGNTNTSGVLKGDCKLFTVAALREMRKAGYYGKAAFADLPNGQLHAVAEYNGLVLDSLQRRVKAKEELTLQGYHWK